MRDQRTSHRWNLLVLWVGLLAGGWARGERIILLSDIDDTIKYSRMRSEGHFFETVVQSVSPRPFEGMPELYKALADNGVEVHYVSNALPVMGLFNGPFMRRSGFPEGEVHYKTEFRGATDYKTRKIKEIMEAHPDAQFILVGDNGEKDPKVFESLKGDPELGPRILGAYVNDLYAPREYTLTRPFYTTADIALQLHRSGVLPEKDLVKILEKVVRSLESSNQNIQERTIPGFSNLAGAMPELRLTHEGLEPRTAALIARMRDAISLRAREYPGADPCPTFYKRLRGNS